MVLKFFKAGSAKQELVRRCVDLYVRFVKHIHSWKIIFQWSIEQRVEGFIIGINIMVFEVYRVDFEYENENR